MGFNQLSGWIRGFVFLLPLVLILSKVDPQTRPSNIGPPYTGHFRVTADTPRGLQPFQPGPERLTTPGKPHPSTERAASATPASKADLKLDIRRNIFDKDGKEVVSKDEKEKQANGDGAAANGTPSRDAATKAMDEAAKEPKKQFYCYSCGIDCTRSRFHYAKTDQTPPTVTGESKYDLCPNCFLQGRLPNTHHASDFVKLEESKYSDIPDKDAPWTDSELLLLLEGLESFDDDWAKISNHVGTRTREECLIKFLQLEIQDQYLNDEPEYESSTMRALNGGRQPISQLENPVMSVVAFLAQMAQPNVVAAAAGKSVEVMRKELRAELEKGMGGDTTDKGKEIEKEKEKEPVKAEDSMDVDNNTAAEVNEPPTEAVDATTTTDNQNTIPASGPAPTATPSQSPSSSLATIGLATAAARAGALASHEEREMTRLVGAAVNLTLQKFELKLAQFTEMEEVVQAERQDLERGRQQLFLDRMAFRKRWRDKEREGQGLKGEGEREGVDGGAGAVGKKFGFVGGAGGTGTGVNGNGSGNANANAEGAGEVKKWEI